MEHQYTNELTSGLAAALALQPFTPEKKAAISESARDSVEEQEVFLLEHSSVTIYQIAVDGALTLCDGMVRAARNGYEIECGGGQRVNVALVGSRLSNVDVIISPSQATSMLNERKGLPMAADFLLAEG